MVFHDSALLGRHGSPYLATTNSCHQHRSSPDNNTVILVNDVQCAPSRFRWDTLWYAHSQAMSFVGSNMNRCIYFKLLPGVDECSPPIHQFMRGRDGIELQKFTTFQCWQCSELRSASKPCFIILDIHIDLT